MAKKLVIKVTAGVDDPERANQAITVASTAIAAGADVSLWLTGEAAWFAVPGRADELVLAHAVPLADLLDVILTSGRVTLCTQCAVRRELNQADLIDGIRIAGSAAFVEEVLADDVQALVY